MILYTGNFWNNEKVTYWIYYHSVWAIIFSVIFCFSASFEYKSPAFVIDTDYTNYAILWACQNNLINGFMRRGIMEAVLIEF